MSQDMPRRLGTVWVAASTRLQPMTRRLGIGPSRECFNAVILDEHVLLHGSLPFGMSRKLFTLMLFKQDVVYIQITA
jgi:hypothetical protein